MCFFNPTRVAAGEGPWCFVQEQWAMAQREIKKGVKKMNEEREKEGKKEKRAERSEEGSTLNRLNGTVLIRF